MNKRFKRGISGSVRGPGRRSKPPTRRGGVALGRKNFGSTPLNKQEKNTNGGALTTNGGSEIPNELIQDMLYTPADEKFFKDQNKVRIAKRTYTLMPFSQKNEIILLSSKQNLFLTELLTHFNPVRAAQIAKVTMKVVKRWFKSPTIRNYFNERKIERAQSAGLTLDYINSLMFQVLAGTKKMKHSQIEVLKLTAKVLGITAKSQPHNPFKDSDTFLFVAKKGNPQQSQGVPKSEEIPRSRPIEAELASAKDIILNPRRKS